MKEEKYFKQLNVYENIDLCYGELSEDQIDVTQVRLCIITLKIIDTIEGTSLEGQHLTGKKVLVNGDICSKIFIRNNDYCRTGYWIDSIIPFSTFIVVPEDICEDECISIRYTIEDATVRILTNRKIFISITFCLEYQDEH